MVQLQINYKRLILNTLTTKTVKHFTQTTTVLITGIFALSTKEMKERAMATRNKICFSNEVIFDSEFCFSGSPLVYNGRVAAVVNWGVPCARG